MAYAALVSLLRTLEEIPQPVQQITSLQEKVSCLLVILEDSSRKESLSINHLEGRIRDASYAAEDDIEFLISRPVLAKSISCGVSSCFWEMIFALQDMFPAIHLRERPVEYTNQNMDLEFKDLQKVVDEFESILEALSKIKDEKVDLQQGNSLTAGSSRSVTTNESALVGLDEDLIHLKDRLTGLPSKLDVISIVGMAGIGKTTLARNLYNDALIEQYFDTRAWIVVSQEYHVEELLTGLLDSSRLVGSELHQKSIEQLAERLYKSLKGRRYLIVMDDVWDTKAWDYIKRFFPDDNNGSRIILTTRQSDLAIYVNSYSPIHHMSLLNAEASWNLLRQKVFGEDPCPSSLEEIGRKIAHNCKGLPLGIMVIGGLLYSNSRTMGYWQYIADNVMSAVTGNIMEILSLSYNSMPHHLKACFLYMGVFPEDYEIFVSQLIKLWIAEGFIKPLTPKGLEEVAEDYLKDLIDRSLILVHKRNHNGKIKTCIIHDLLRELSVKKAQDEKFLQIVNPQFHVFPEGRNNQRRVSIHSNILDELADIQDSSVRSLLYFCKRRSNNQLLSFTMSSRLLRVLDALTIRFYEFPTEIVELIHLRYLAFIYRGKKKLPASISKLLNLQTLIVYRGNFMSNVDTLYLPSNIWQIPQLRHLLFERSSLPYPFHAHIVGRDRVVLQNLQTLSEVTNFRCTREVLEIMPNLKKLGLSYFYDTQTKWSSYEFNNFVYLRQLETLKCLFIAKNSRACNSFPGNFAFPPTLKKLTLSGCRISWQKMTIVGSLPNLEVLKLKNTAFGGSVWEPNEGEFLKLKFLLIHVATLRHWRANNTHFPLLQHLSLSFCSNLLEIPSEIGDIPTLEMIELYNCRPSAEASAMLILDEQQSLENYGLRVRVNSFGDNYASHENTSLRKVHRTFSRSDKINFASLTEDALRKFY